MKVAVVGAGVAGLTCAWRVSEYADVTVVHDLPTSLTTSAIATAVWHVYLVDPGDVDVLRWSQRTLIRLCELTTDPLAGVSLVSGVELFRTSEPHRPTWADSAIDFAMLGDAELASRFPGARWGYRLAAPAANMAKYLPWLSDGCQRRGVRFEARRIASWDDLRDFDYVVNCCGLRTRDLTPDGELFGMRGQYLVLRPRPEWIGHEYVGDDEHPDGMAYMIPRDGELMVGGTEELTEEMIFDVSESDMLRRAGTFCGAALDGAVIARRVVGLRPCRRSGKVVLGPDPDDSRLIHNYGHGGSGFSLSWGCADDVSSHLMS